MIRLEQVEKAYLGAGPVLRGASLALDRGELGVLLGRSGSGKSTLLNIIAALERPDAGTVRVAGRDLAAMGQDTAAGFRLLEVGIVFQFFNLLPTLTLRDNVALPAALAGRGAVEARKLSDRWLERVGLSDAAPRMPHEASGGEIQRAAVARAFVNAPKVVLADEPTGNLDVSSGERVIELFRSLAHDENATVLIVTHDPSVERSADRVFRLVEGVVQT